MSWNGAACDPLVERQLTPFFWKGRLCHVDRGKSLDFRKTKLWFGSKRDEFRIDDRLRVICKLDFTSILRSKRSQANGPFTGSHLRFHSALVIHRDWNRTVDGGKLESSGKDPTQILLAALSRYGNLDVRE